MPSPVVPPGYVFPHNWISRVVFRTGWLTDVTSGIETGAESRRSLLDKPTREIQFQIESRDADQAREILEYARRMGTYRFSIPVYSDFVLLKQQFLPELVLVDRIIAFRRLFIGQKVAVVHPTTGAVEIVELREITLDAMLFRSPGLLGGFPPGSWIYPLMDCELAQDVELVGLNANVITLQLTAQEVNGPSTLPPSYAGPVSGIYGTQTSLDPNSPKTSQVPTVEVFPHNWIQGLPLRFQRELDSYDGGKEPIVVERTKFPRESMDLQINGEDRIAFLQLFLLHEACRGRSKSFFVRFPYDHWPQAVTTLGVRSVVLPAVGRLLDWQAKVFHTYLGFAFNGQLYLRQFRSVTDLGSGMWRFEWDDALPQVATNCAVHEWVRMRFEDDTLEEVWETSEVCVLQKSLIEVHDEDEHGLENYETHTSEYPEIEFPASNVFPHHFFVAGQNAFCNVLPPGGVNKRYRAVPGPYSRNLLHFWCDAREDVPDPFEPLVDPNNFRYPFLISLPAVQQNPRPILVNPPAETETYGQLGIANPEWALSYRYPRNFGGFDYEDNLPFSNTLGMTMFVVVSRATNPHPQDSFPRSMVRASYGTAPNNVVRMFEWFNTHSASGSYIRAYNEAGAAAFVGVPSVQSIPYTCVWMLRWGPNKSLSLYVNGIFYNTVSVNRIRTGSGFVEETLFDAISYRESYVAQHSALFGENPRLLAWLSYKRELNNNFANAVGDTLSRSFNARWVPLP